MNIATNAAAAGEPVAIFSLEMSKEEIVQRILSSVGKVDSMKLRSGQLGPLWQRVVDAAGRMYKAPIYIDDSPVVTVTDIRAKCRRLKRKKGLSLIVVDYLQLMESHGGENRQQEIAQISRHLKNLARELEVPIIAVSQRRPGEEGDSRGHRRQAPCRVDGPRGDDIPARVHPVRQPRTRRHLTRKRPSGSRMAAAEGFVTCPVKPVEAPEWGLNRA
jgi:replicative DNA helicase